MSLLYLMRHGQASFGQADYDQLSELGWEQSRHTGRSLRARGLRLDAAYCGSMARQRDTGLAVLAELEDPPALETIPGFDEYDSQAIMRELLPGLVADEPELDQYLPRLYSDRKSFQMVYERAMRRWVADSHPLESAETWAAFCQRLEAALEQVRGHNERGRTVMVFASGGSIAGVARLALGLAGQATLRLTWSLVNASLTSLFFGPASLSLASFNCTAHLEGRDGLITYR